MAKRTKKSAENKVAKTAAPAVETTPAPITPKLIVAQCKFDRWYVYFKGVAPKDNVGCGCKTAKSAMRYMHLLKARYGATISQNVYERLELLALCKAKNIQPLKLHDYVRICMLHKTRALALLRRLRHRFHAPRIVPMLARQRGLYQGGKCNSR